VRGALILGLNVITVHNKGRFFKPIIQIIRHSNQSFN
jgi:hypothetical protein